MFEKFDMNQQSFIDELEILRIIKAYRHELSAWHEWYKNNFYDLKTKTSELYLPVSSFNKIRKCFEYTMLTIEQLESFKKVIFADKALLSALFLSILLFRHFMISLNQIQKMGSVFG